MSHLREVNSSETSIVQQVQEKCCNATVLKITLFVFGLLLGAGAVVAHLYHVNAIAVYSMGSVGGVLVLCVAIASVVHYVQNRRAEEEARAEEKERKDQDFQASVLGLEITQLPESTSERRQVIENEKQRRIEEATGQAIRSCDAQILAMRNAIDIFKRIINNPEEPLELVRGGIFVGTHQEKIDHFWWNLKLGYCFQNMGGIFLKFGGLDQNETIIQQQQKIAELKNQFLQVRQTSYRGFIQTLGREELLKEAQKYYLKGISQEEKEHLQDSIEHMTLETIVPKLRERTLAQDQKDYDIVEIQQIILQIESI